ncbi:Uncharacterised protein [Serratia quinivorans]|uniref:Lipoprotein n=1 Tax=Serratia quinivorans TaxID=137545 RepID=A0A380AKY3_9GAMM|nr:MULTISPECIES: hypothetical protein [Serratia]SUI82029.1 Uncharacterised protein [Serratia quinivorans]
MKKAAFILGALALSAGIAACSNVLTYIRHDESVQCSSDKALKRDSICNVQPVSK